MKIFLTFLWGMGSLCSMPDDETIRAYFLAPEIADLPIPDWYNPTVEDYAIIQQHIRANFIRVVEMPESQRILAIPMHADSGAPYGCITYRISRLRLVKSNDIQGSVPEFKIVYFNNDPEKRDKCVICYTSWALDDTDWSRGIQFKIDRLRECNFDGHFIYQIGGWPNVAKGRLKFADVPYAFKPFMCEQVRDLGYKNILWLDACVFPIKNLDPIFKWIEKNGCCFFSDGDYDISQHRMEEWGYVMRSMGFKPQKPYQALLSQVVGINTDHPEGARLLNGWIEAAEKKVPFLEPSGDQLSFTTLINEYKLLHCRLPHFYYMGLTDKIERPDPNCRAILCHQYCINTPGRDFSAWSK